MKNPKKLEHDEKEFTRIDTSFRSHGATCAAWLYLPEGISKPPVIIMAHGFGGQHAHSSVGNPLKRRTWDNNRGANAGHLGHCCPGTVCGWAFISTKFWIQAPGHIARAVGCTRCSPVGSPTVCAHGGITEHFCHDEHTRCPGRGEKRLTQGAGPGRKCPAVIAPSGAFSRPAKYAPDVKCPAPVINTEQGTLISPDTTKSTAMYADGDHDRSAHQAFRPLRG